MSKDAHLTFLADNLQKIDMEGKHIKSVFSTSTSLVDRLRLVDFLFCGRTIDHKQENQRTLLHPA